MKKINVEETPGAIHALKAMGFSELPIVVTDDDRWSRYRLDKILTDIGKDCRDAS